MVSNSQIPYQRPGTVLALDEIQKISDWSESVKRLWDEDTRRKMPLRVVLLGSAPLLIARGMTESLAGRFEPLHLPHWSFAEMRDAFLEAFRPQRTLLVGGDGIGLDEFLARPVSHWTQE